MGCSTSISRSRDLCSVSGTYNLDVANDLAWNPAGPVLAGTFPDDRVVVWTVDVDDLRRSC